MAYKSKKQKEAEAAIAAAAEAKAAAAAAAPNIPVDVFESKAFEEAFASYRKSVGSIPGLLGGILREAVAVRIILEGKV